MTVATKPTGRRLEMQEAPPLSWTHEDFLRLAAEDQKAELIQGEL